MSINRIGSLTKIFSHPFYLYYVYIYQGFFIQGVTEFKRSTDMGDR